MDIINKQVLTETELLLATSTITPKIIENQISMSDFVKDTQSIIVERYRRRMLMLNKNWLAICIGKTGCLSGVTTIFCNNKVTKIKDAPDIFLTKAVDGTNIVDTLAILQKTGEKKVYKITFKSGKTAITTNDHKFFTKYGWKKLKQLNENDDVFSYKNCTKNIRKKWLKSNKIQRNRNKDWILHKEIIQNIKEIGYTKTYDLLVPNLHNYILANGLIVHNSGKSYTALSLAEEIDPTFDISRVIFQPSDFLTLFHENKIKRGQMVIFEEAGVAIGSRDFMSKINRAINYFLQSFRSKNTGVIFTLPSLSMIDTQTRMLAHTILEPTSIDRGTNTASVKLMEIDTNARLGKTYNHYIKVLIDGKIFKLTHTEVKIPSRKLRIEYEKKKDEFVTDLATVGLNKITPTEDDKETEKYSEFDIEKMITDLAKNPEEFHDHKNRLTITGISTGFNIPQALAKKVLFTYAKRKRQQELLELAKLPINSSAEDNNVSSFQKGV